MLRPIRGNNEKKQIKPALEQQCEPVNNPQSYFQKPFQRILTKDYSFPHEVAGRDTKGNVPINFK